MDVSELEYLLRTVKRRRAMLSDLLINIKTGFGLMGTGWINVWVAGFTPGMEILNQQSHLTLLHGFDRPCDKHPEGRRVHIYLAFWERDPEPLAGRQAARSEVVIVVARYNEAVPESTSVSWGYTLRMGDLPNQGVYLNNCHSKMLWNIVDSTTNAGRIDYAERVAGVLSNWMTSNMKPPTFTLGGDGNG